MSLSTNDAFLLIDVLNWNKKFVTTELKNAFPLLRKETNSLEKNLILKSVARRKISRKPGILPSFSIFLGQLKILICDHSTSV